MKIANIADFKNHLSELLADVERGEEIEVRKRNVAIARVIPINRASVNRTVLGRGRGSVKIRGDLARPILRAGDWGSIWPGDK